MENVINKKIIEIKNWILEDIEKLMDLHSENGELFNEFGIEEDTTLYRFTAKFNDGHFADINVNSGQENCWIDFVFYNEEGNEIECFGGNEGCIYDKETIKFEQKIATHSPSIVLP